MYRVKIWNAHKMAAIKTYRRWSRIIVEVLLFMLQTTFIYGMSNSCQDVDHEACVDMLKQSPNMCSDPNLGTIICPAFCNNCPLMCYSCSTTTYNVSNCNTITCGTGEDCLMKQYINKTTTMFKMSCDTAQICRFKKRTIGAQCCSTDLCNIPVPLTTAQTSSTKSSTSSSAFTITPRTLPTTKLTPMTSQTNLTTTRSLSTTAQSLPTTTQMFSTSTKTVTTPGTLTTITPFDQRSKINQRSLNLMQSINASCRSDVIVLMDESCGYDIFTSVVKQILRDVFNQSDIGSNKVRVALSSFNTMSQSRWDLDSHTDKVELLRVLDKLSIQGDGDTDNFVAIDNLLKSRRIMDVVLMFSCSQRDSSLNKRGNFENELNQLHALYSSVIMIGLDGAIMEDLAMYASDMFHLFSIPSALLYTHDYIVEWILHEICPVTV